MRDGHPHLDGCPAWRNVFAYVVEPLKDRERYRRLAFWAGLAAAATFLLQFGLGQRSFYVLIALAAAALGAAWSLAGAPA